MKQVIEFRKFKEDEFFHLIQKLNKKANKYNIPNIEYKFISERSEKLSFDDREDIRRGYDIKIKKYVTYEISQDISIRIGGWYVLGSIERFGNENIICEFSDESLIQYSANDYHCDHCQHNRFRGKVYILKNVETSEYKQVGSTCLEDFTQEKNIDYILFFLEPKKHFLSLNEDDLGERYEEMRPILSHFLIDIFAIVDIDGRYITKREGFGTVDKYNYYSKDDQYLSREDIAQKRRIIEKRCENRDKYYEMALKAIEYCVENFKNSSNSFEHNLYAICSEETFPEHMKGSAGYIAEIYRKNFVKNDSESEFIGKIGDKVNLNLKLTESNVYTGNSKSSYEFVSFIYKFIDDKGNLFSWSSSKELFLKENALYSLSGTIKDHKEYNGKKYTILTRCKVEEK